MITLQFLTGTTLSAFLKERIVAMQNRTVLYHGHPYSKDAIALSVRNNRKPVQRFIYLYLIIKSYASWNAGAAVCRR